MVTGYKSCKIVCSMSGPVAYTALVRPKQLCGVGTHLAHMFIVLSAAVAFMVSVLPIDCSQYAGDLLKNTARKLS